MDNNSKELRVKDFNVISNQESFMKYKGIISKDNLFVSLPVSALMYQKLNIRLDELNIIVLHLDEFFKLFSGSCLTEGKIIARLFTLIVGFGLVGKTNVQERDLDANDFPHTAQYSEKCFECLKNLLQEIQTKSYSNFMENSDRRQIIISCLLLLGTHNKEYLWSSGNLVSLSTDFQALILAFTNNIDFSSLLCSDNFHPTIFKGVLKALRPSLMKDTWLQYPSSCYVFSWLLQLVKHPNLVDYINDIFPPPCMFISGFQLCHKVLAIECFDHMLDNIPSTEMKLDGKEEVIYNLLSPSLHSSESEIISILYPCLLKLPTVKYQSKMQIGWSRYDEILHHLLRQAEIECSVMLKQIYLSHILLYLKVVPPFKHLKRLMKLMEETLVKNSDLVCQYTALTILRVVIKSCWPSMGRYCLKILESIALLLDKFESSDDLATAEDIKKFYEVINECLSLLKCSCKEEFHNILIEYVENGSDMPGINIFQSFLHEN